MARIIIKHLGTIKEFEMDMKEYHLLTGEQAANRNTISKAIYFFRSIKNELIQYLYTISIDGNEENGRFPKVFNSRCKNIFVKLFGYSWKLPEDLKMEYYFSQDIFIYVYLKQNYKGNRYISINYSDKMYEELKYLEKGAINFFCMEKQNDAAPDLKVSEHMRQYQKIVNDVNIIMLEEPEYY